LYITRTTCEIRIIERSRTFKHLIGYRISDITRIVLELDIGSLRSLIRKYLRICLGWNTCHRSRNSRRSTGSCFSHGCCTYIIFTCESVLASDIGCARSSSSGRNHTFSIVNSLTFRAATTEISTNLSTIYISNLSTYSYTIGWIIITVVPVIVLYLILLVHSYGATFFIGVFIHAVGCNRAWIFTNERPCS
jgi:hypothetical protein